MMYEGKIKRNSHRLTHPKALLNQSWPGATHLFTHITHLFFLWLRVKLYIDHKNFKNTLRQPSLYVCNVSSFNTHNARRRQTHSNTQVHVFCCNHIYHPWRLLCELTSTPLSTILVSFFMSPQAAASRKLPSNTRGAASASCCVWWSSSFSMLFCRGRGMCIRVKSLLSRILSSFVSVRSRERKTGFGVRYRINS